MTKHDILPASLTIRAMRSNGFKNAAYAIAEIVDNSIQAGANIVEIICKEEAQSSARPVVKEIAIVDNGKGMSIELLRNALQFGNGERLDDRSGIGRFGMGLPNSSISQAKHVDVYTWQDGVENAYYSYLDIPEIEQGSISEVPLPIKKHVPKEWLSLSATASQSKSGTIVVWKDLDRCAWKTAKAIFRNSEFIIGRIYRKFIDKNKVSIKMLAFSEGNLAPNFSDTVKANDPLYLMKTTSTPGKWGAEPMFSKHGEDHEFEWNGQKIKIALSIAKKEAREGSNAGSRDYGRHAANNVGVSIIRADRELDLQRNGWVISYNPVERWWGAEIDFPPALDELFGVPNNKQGASALEDFASVSLDELAEREGYRNQHEMEDEWKKYNDPRLVLLRIKRYLDSNLSVIRKTLAAQNIQNQRRYSDDNARDSKRAEIKGTEATKRRRDEEGIISPSDQDETKPKDVRIKEIANALESDGLSSEEANELAQKVLSDGRKYEFVDVDLATPELFSVRPKGGVILIGLNINHPAYNHLLTIKELEDINDMNELKVRMKKSHEALKLLIEAWARYEDELSDGIQRTRASDARIGWGMVAREFFRDE